MRISQCDNEGRIFEIQDIISPELVKEILSIKWNQVLTRSVDLPAVPHRYHISRHFEFMNKFEQEIHKAIPAIEDACRVRFLKKTPSCAWWLDRPGFSIRTHTDGEIRSAMQLYWLAPDSDYGTVFYNRPGVEVLKQFKSIANTGYIMLNDRNSDGSQPLLWHGMNNTVPSDCFRLTTYCVLGEYRRRKSF